MRGTPFCKRVGTAHYNLQSQNTPAEEHLLFYSYNHDTLYLETEISKPVKVGSAGVASDHSYYKLLSEVHQAGSMHSCYYIVC